MDNQKIKDLKVEILEKRRLLKQLRQEQKLAKRANQKSFLETKFGRGYLRTLRAMTAPFATVHKFSSLALGDELLQKPEKSLNDLLSKTREVPGAADKQAPLVVKELVEYYFYNMKNLSEDNLKQLKEEIDRLRTAEDKERGQELRGRILDVLMPKEAS